MARQRLSVSLSLPLVGRRSLAMMPLMMMILLQLFPTISSSSSPPWKGAPWQSSSSGGDGSQSLLEQLRYNDLSPTIFSPTGRLHPVERTMEQVRQPDARSNLVVALHCQDGMLMLSTVPLSPYLNTTITPLHDKNNSSTTNNTLSSGEMATPTTASLFLVENVEDDSDQATTTTLPIVDLASGIIGATAGKALDCQVLRLRMQALVQQLVQDDLDQTAPSSDGSLVSKVARTLADQLQTPTQNTNSRQGPLLASAAVVLGHRQLWRIDPTGQFWNCHAAVVGRESDRAEEELVTKLLERMNNAAAADDDENAGNNGDLGQFLKSSMTCDDALDLVCECLQSVFWPASLNLQGLPAGIRLTLPSIPWVAVTLRDAPETESTTKAATRQIRRGAFLPPLVTDTEEKEKEE